ncbi:hypothetical protein [Modicisalibacter luteus]|uniref:hypothetical protein n=1 Tax=Modicisalibacter luteus TaxID=453962 RepID=UPI00363AC99B
MELSQLLAGSSTAASVPPGKSEGKANGNDNAEFARLYKQAGETNKRTAADTPTTKTGPDKKLLAEEASQSGALDHESGSLEQDQLIATAPDELAPLTQQVIQAIEGKLSGNAKTLEQQVEGLASAQAENGNFMAATLASLSAGTGESLADIRQRLDMIASAQRGDTPPPSKTRNLLSTQRS